MTSKLIIATEYLYDNFLKNNNRESFDFCTINKDDVISFWENLRDYNYKDIIFIADVFSISKELDLYDVVVPVDHINFLINNPLISYFKNRAVEFFDIKSFYKNRKFNLKKMNYKEKVLLGVENFGLVTPTELKFYQSTGADFISKEMLDTVLLSYANKLDILLLGIVTITYDNKVAKTEELKRKLDNILLELS